MLTIDLTQLETPTVVRQLLQRLGDTRPLLQEIGEDLSESARQRFVTSTAPDGTKWAPNSQATMDRYGAMFGSSLRKKDGSLNAKGEKRLAGKKPLVGESRALGTTIAYQLVDAEVVKIGSALPYAAIQQFGGKKANFAHLWGDIPARPFLGVSDADGQRIMELVRDYLVR